MFDFYAPDCVRSPPLVQPLLEQVNLWVGVRETKTNLHYDAHENVLAVVRGVKSLVLLDPAQTPWLAPAPAYRGDANHSAGRDIAAAERAGARCLRVELRAGGAPRVCACADAHGECTEQQTHARSQTRCTSPRAGGTRYPPRRPLSP
jgi:hypothetical protein